MALVTKTVVENHSTFDHEVQYFGKVKNFLTKDGIWIQKASYSVLGKKGEDGKRQKAFMDVSVFSDSEIMTTPGFYSLSGHLTFSVYSYEDKDTKAQITKIQLNVNNAVAQFIETPEQRFGSARSSAKPAPRPAQKEPEEELAF